MLLLEQIKQELKELLLEQIKQFFLEGESPTLIVLIAPLNKRKKATKGSTFRHKINK